MFVDYFDYSIDNAYTGHLWKNDSITNKET